MSVYCTVSNCQWWNNNKCSAESILITSDSVSDNLPEKYDYPHLNQIVQQVGTTPVSNSMESCCKTFTHKKG
ncbi:MAG: hypothetical protein PWQ91_1194 [Eubacteriales bacterium]|nr:hypothetical protein [Eubacteriales bacterium]MDN5364133.1 hypothetical protein [Eubacteriales bacterium]